LLAFEQLHYRRIYYTRLFTYTQLHIMQHINIMDKIIEEHLWIREINVSILRQINNK